MIARSLSSYLNKYRPVLAQKSSRSGALWLSSNDGQPMTYHGLAAAITRTTGMAVSVGVSPHMFRAAAASSAAVHAEHSPHLGSASLHHRDRRVTEEHYNRASTVSAAKAFGQLIKDL
jgi:integrase